MLTIGEFSRLSRVSAKALRYYDQIGLLKPGYVSPETGYRYYEVGQLHDMLLISRLKQYRFSLPEIATVLTGRDRDGLAEMMRAKKAEFSQQISDQQRTLLQMERDIQTIERCEDMMQANYLIKTTQFQPRNIFSVRRQAGVSDLGRIFGDLCGRMEKSRLKPCGPFLTVYHAEDFNHACTDLEAGAVVAESGVDGVRRLDPGLCCFATHIGPYDDFSACYAALGEWIEREGYTISGPPFEWYVKGCDDDVGPEEYVTEIYFPIKK